jgi:hypothetical protein
MRVLLNRPSGQIPAALWLMIGGERVRSPAGGLDVTGGTHLRCSGG